MSTFLKIVLVEPSLILRSGMSYVLRRLTTFDVQVVETGEPEQLEELIAEAAPDVLIINPSLTDEEMLRELQQKSLRLIAFQSVLADARLMQLVDEGHEVLRRAVAGGRRKVACHLVAPGSVERVFRQRHQLNVRKAHFLHIRDQLVAELVVSCLLYTSPSPRDCS